MYCSAMKYKGICFFYHCAKVHLYSLFLNKKTVIALETFINFRITFIFTIDSITIDLKKINKI